MGTPFSPGPLWVPTRGTSLEADMTRRSLTHISARTEAGPREGAGGGPAGGQPRALSLEELGPAPTAAVPASEGGLPGARGTPASPPPPASGSRGARVGCCQPHPHGPSLTARGQLKLNETHRPGARSSAHGHALVRAPAPLPSRPLRCVRGGGHSLRRLVRAGKSRVGRQAWTLVWASGDRLPWKPSRPCPAERSRTPPPPPEEACGTDFSPRAWGHRRWPWGQHVRCSGPCGPVPFPEAGAVRGQRCSFLRIDTECPIYAPLSPTQAAGLQPPARCFEPSARPAPALSLCPPLAPHLALHAFGLGETPLCGLILHRRDSPTAQGLAVQWR